MTRSRRSNDGPNIATRYLLSAVMFAACSQANTLGSVGAFNPEPVCRALSSELATRAQLLDEETSAQASAPEASARSLLVEDRSLALRSLRGALMHEASGEGAEAACNKRLAPVSRTTACRLVADLLVDIGTLCERGLAQLGAAEDAAARSSGDAWLAGVRLSRSCADLDRTVRVVGGSVALLELGNIVPSPPAECSRMAPQAEDGAKFEIDPARRELSGLTGSARRIVKVYAATCGDARFDGAQYCQPPQSGPQ